MAWLREEKGDLYNDFLLMIEQLRPPYLRVTCAGVTSEDKALMEFLKGRPPLWPVV